MLHKTIILLFLACLMLSCQQSSSKCKLGDPVAIFSDTMLNINYHTFKLVDQGSVEQARLSNGWDVTISQKGCEDLRQEFIVELPTQLTKVPAMDCSTVFQVLGTQSESLFGMQQWAEAVRGLGDELQFSKDIDLAPGIRFECDQLVMNDKTIMTLIISTQNN